MPTIYTHSGQFHADEACACALLRIAARKKLPIVRTRDEDVLAAALPTDYLVDVGGVYDPKTQRFDHHQDTFEEHYPGSKTKMSSFGLVWLRYGEELVGSSEAAKSFYFRFVEGVDAHDNGVPHLPKGTRTNYRMLGVGQTISHMNGPDSYNHEDQATRFDMAVTFAYVALTSLIEAEILDQQTEKKNNAIVRSCIPDVKDGVLVIKERLVGKRNIDFTLMDSANPLAAKVCFIVTPRDPAEGTWSIWTVCKSKKDMFTKRKYLLSEEEARALVGDDLIFVHRARFVGSTRTFESALAVAKASAAPSLQPVCANVFGWDVKFEDSEVAVKPEEYYHWVPIGCLDGNPTEDPLDRATSILFNLDTHLDRLRGTEAGRDLKAAVEDIPPQF